MKVHELMSLNIPTKALLYSIPGQGKTELLLTLGDRCQYIDCDGNLEVAFGLHDNLRDVRLNVDIVQFLEEDPMHKAVAFGRLKHYIYGLPAEIKAGRFKKEALVIDSLTSMAVGAQWEIMGNASRIGMNPQIQEWGLIITQIENIIMALRALPIRVFVAAHQQEFVDPEDKTQIQIAIPGQKLPSKIIRLFTEIWYLRIRAIGEGKQELYIQTTPTQGITCRSGKGLRTNYVYGTIDKQGKPGKSVGLWDILKEIEHVPSGSPPILSPKTPVATPAAGTSVPSAPQAPLLDKALAGKEVTSPTLST